MENLKELSINGLAEEIKKDWKNVNFGAKPYLEAMLEIRRITDSYYQDSAKSVVLYFLANASTWKGETAKVVKTELKLRCKTA